MEIHYNIKMSLNDLSSDSLDLRNRIEALTDNLEQLVDFRTKHKYLVDNYMFDVWCKVLNNGNLDEAFEKNNYYVIESALNAIKWYNKDDNALLLSVSGLASDIIVPIVLKYEFNKKFVENSFREIDDVMMKFGYIDTLYESDSPLTYTCQHIKFG